MFFYDEFNLYGLKTSMGPLRNGDGDEESPSDVIDQMIAKNLVAIFSKTYCPHCAKIKEFFKSKNIEFQALELDIMGTQGKEIQATLLQRTGQSTVPNVWVNRKFIGKRLLMSIW